jgi:hypothetical protein
VRFEYILLGNMINPDLKREKSSAILLIELISSWMIPKNYFYREIIQTKVTKQNKRLSPFEVEEQRGYDSENLFKNSDTYQRCSEISFIA